MKALQMLDHVMLWVARIYITLVFLLLVIIEINQQDYQQSFRHGNGPILLICVPMPALTAIMCLWSLERISARLYLGACVTLIFLWGIRERIVFPYWSPEPLFLLINTLGLISVLWVATRPPQNPAITSPLPLPQSC